MDELTRELLGAPKRLPPPSPDTWEAILRRRRVLLGNDEDKPIWEEVAERNEAEAAHRMRAATMPADAKLADAIRRYQRRRGQAQ